MIVLNFEAPEYLNTRILLSITHTLFATVETYLPLQELLVLSKLERLLLPSRQSPRLFPLMSTNGRLHT
jgi:hypothetical protein